MGWKLKSKTNLLILVDQNIWNPRFRLIVIIWTGGETFAIETPNSTTKTPWKSTTWVTYLCRSAWSCTEMHYVVYMQTDHGGIYCVRLGVIADHSWMWISMCCNMTNRKHASELGNPWWNCFRLSLVLKSRSIPQDRSCHFGDSASSIVLVRKPEIPLILTAVT